jgi:hypothetical protein
LGAFAAVPGLLVNIILIIRPMGYEPKKGLWKSCVDDLSGLPRRLPEAVLPFAWPLFRDVFWGILAVPSRVLRFELPVRWCDESMDKSPLSQLHLRRDSPGAAEFFWRPPCRPLIRAETALSRCRCLAPRSPVGSAKRTGLLSLMVELFPASFKGLLLGSTVADSVPVLTRSTVEPVTGSFPVCCLGGRRLQPNEQEESLCWPRPCPTYRRSCSPFGSHLDPPLRGLPYRRTLASGHRLASQRVRWDVQLRASSCVEVPAAPPPQPEGD